MELKNHPLKWLVVFGSSRHRQSSQPPQAAGQQATRASKRAKSLLPTLPVQSPTRSGWQMLKEGAGRNLLLPTAAVGATTHEKSAVAPGPKCPELLLAPCPSPTTPQSRNSSDVATLAKFISAYVISLEAL